MFDFLLDIVFPRFCVGCGKIGKYFCHDCSKTIRFYSHLISPNYKKIPYLDGVNVLAHYDGIIRKAIKEVKYRGKYAIFSEIAPKIKPSFQFSYLIPVPLSKKRLQKRGFNQAEKLANYLKLAPVLNCLERTRDTKPQFDLKLHEREDNVRNAFGLISNTKYLISNKSICLIDDVATTGATLSECAKVLKKAGAK
ncbi:ComF family protein, partial [Candidatus Microgenomates bacterium]|nr:ComF family protein [Candidatus Microgenomates bacterium]